ncbi:pentapeptide repeat-containing protein [Candidatus Poribacteria bacterium]|nr:pentapeptide repeat-containing protein [Candidatus Poribacteria bacterium]
MATFRKHYDGTIKAENQTITAEEFLAALVGDCERLGLSEDYERVELVRCRIEGEVNIHNAEADRDEEGKYVIGKEIECRWCIFKHPVKFERTRFRKDTKFWQNRFKQPVYYNGTTFERNAKFTLITFERGAVFTSVTFKKNAKFLMTQFKQPTHFRGARFEQKADFTETTFQNYAYFRSVSFQEPASFQGIRYWPDTIAQWWCQRLFNNWLFWKLDGLFWRKDQELDVISHEHYVRENPRWLTRWLIKMIMPENAPDRRPTAPTEFQLDSQNIDEVTNPFFKRYIADQQFIRDFKKKHRVWARLWRWSSDYGRSFGRWARLSLIIVLFFGCAYAHEILSPYWYLKPFGWQISVGVAVWAIFVLLVVGASTRYLLKTIRSKESWKNKAFRCVIKLPVPLVILALLVYVVAITIGNLDFIVANTLPEDGQKPERTEPNFITYFYFSVVTFTTLGFGDITPKNHTSEMWLIVEVILGYIMLGGLISIFANKLARRS